MCCIESEETQTFMNRITISVLTTFIILVTGCGWPGIRGNGHITTDQRTVTAFSEIEAEGAFEIEWRSGAPALSIMTDENLLPYIENRNIGNRLRLHPGDARRQNCHFESDPLCGKTHRRDPTNRQSTLRREVRCRIHRRSARRAR